MQIINVNQVKKEIYPHITKCYGETNFAQLYSLFSLDKSFGLIFLFNSTFESPFFICDSLNFLIKSFFDKSNCYNQTINKIKELSASNKYIIKPFDGELPTFPYKYDYNYAPINEIKKFITIIDYVAAGYAPAVNPNLISSLGYYFQYEKI